MTTRSTTIPQTPASATDDDGDAGRAGDGARAQPGPVALLGVLTLCLAAIAAIGIVGMAGIGHPASLHQPASAGGGSGLDWIALAVSVGLMPVLLALAGYLHQLTLPR